MFRLLRKKNIVKKLAPILLLVGLSFSLATFYSITAIAEPTDPGATGGNQGGANANTDQPPGGQDSQTEDNQQGEEEITCAINKIGWILCPVIETLGSLGDQAFQFLAKNFLETEPELVASAGNINERSGTYTAWELARNIANVLFIAAFLIIILSQVTGQGISNYGIKKLLPRLIIAAIAVNVSYYICQIMVDLSNILGYEIQNFLVDMSRTVSEGYSAMPPQVGGDYETSTGTLGAIVAFVLSWTAGIMILLAIIILVPGLVVVTVITIIAILLMRKAFIVMLVVLSPIAFVAYLLPNTEQYFRKWLSMFWKLLMVFPVVGLLFGAGQLASSIILVSGTNTQSDSEYRIQNSDDPNSPSDEKCIQLPQEQADGSYSDAEVKDCGENSTPVLLGLVAAGIAVAPLLAVWSVLKGALSAAGAIGGKIAGTVETYTGKGVDKFGKGPGARMSKKAGIVANNNRMANLATGGIYRRRARRKRIDANLDKELGRAEIDYTSGLAASTTRGGDRFRRQLAGGRLVTATDQGAVQRAEATAIAEQDKLRSEAQQAASILTRDMSQTQLRDIALKDGVNINDPMVAAAIEALGEAQDFASLEKIMDKYANAGPSLVARSLSQALSKNAPGMFTGGQIAALSKGDYRPVNDRGEEVKNIYEHTVRENLEHGVMTAEKLATINPTVASEISDVIARTGSTDARIEVNKEWAKVKGDSILNKKISRIEKQMDTYSTSGYVRNTKRDE